MEIYNTDYLTIDAYLMLKQIVQSLIVGKFCDIGYWIMANYGSDLCYR